MRFAGHLTIADPAIGARVAAHLSTQLFRDGFALEGENPLIARRKTNAFARFGKAARGRFGFASLWRAAREIGVAIPVHAGGTIAYGIDNPGLGRLLGLILLAPTYWLYREEGLVAAILAATLGAGLFGIALHYAMRRAALAYMQLRGFDYSGHRLTMG